MSGCLFGPALLGTLIVNDPGGGDLCFVPSSTTGRIGGTSCDGPAPGPLYDWPMDFRVTGVSTDGGEPCASGRACDEDAVGPVGFG